LNKILSEKLDDYIQKLKKLLPEFLGFNIDPFFYGTYLQGIPKTEKQSQEWLKKDFLYRWEFWIQKLIQHKILDQIVDVIPVP
jgi:hypothetical protein